MVSSITQEIENEDRGARSSSSSAADGHHYHNDNAAVEQSSTSVDSGAGEGDETIPEDAGNIGDIRVKPRQTIRHGNPVNVIEYHFHKDVSIYGGVSSVNIKDNVVCNNQDSVLSDIEIITRQKSTRTQKNVHERRDHSKDSQSCTTPSSSTATNINETSPSDIVPHFKRRNEIRGQKRVSQVHLREDNTSLNDSSSGFRYPGVTLSDPGVASRGSVLQDPACIEEEGRTRVPSSRQRRRALGINHAADGSLKTRVGDISDDVRQCASSRADCSTIQSGKAASFSSTFSVVSSQPSLRIPSPCQSKPNHHSFAPRNDQSATVNRAPSPSRIGALPACQPPFVSDANYQPDYQRELSFRDQATYGLSMLTNPHNNPQFNLPSSEHYQQPSPGYYQETAHGPLLVLRTGVHEQANPSSAWYDATQQRSFEHRQDDTLWNPFMGIYRESRHHGRTGQS